MSDQFGMEGFYTFTGYARAGRETMTASMEDYLEMIYRLYRNDEAIKIKKISDILHVKPSSASKMANILKREAWIDFEPYGQITLTERGKRMGKYLLFRHDVLHRFFCYMNKSQDELALVEKIEHFIDQRTVYNINAWLTQLPQQD